MIGTGFTCRADAATLRARTVDAGGPMSLDQGISDLIGKIYRGARDAAAWDDALVDLLAATGSRFTMVSAVDLATGGYLHNRFFGPDDARFLDGVAEYDDHMYRDDPTLAFARRHPGAGFVSMTMAELRAGTSSHYRRWTGGMLGTGDSAVHYDTLGGDVMIGMSLHPPVARGAHDARDLELMRLLFGHVRQAVEQVIRPIDMATTDRAAIALDRHGDILAMSAPAEAVLARGDGIGVAGRRIAIDDASAQARFGRLLRAALSAMDEGTTGGMTAIERPSGRGRWIVRVAVAPAPWNPVALRHPAALVTIVATDPDPDDAAHPDAELARLFALTPAEAAVAGRLAAGARDLDIAQALAVKPSTVRSHVKEIFAKTHTRSKPELVYLLGRLARGL